MRHRNKAGAGIGPQAGRRNMRIIEQAATLALAMTAQALIVSAILI